VQTVVAAQAGVAVEDPADDGEPDAVEVQQVPPVPQLPMHPTPAPQIPAQAPQPQWANPWGQSSAATPPPAPAPVPVPVTPTDAMDPALVKRLRGKLAEIVTALEGAPADQWEAIVINGVVADPQVLDLLRASTVRGALRDIGTDETTITRIIAYIDQRNIMADLPRG